MTQKKMPPAHAKREFFKIKLCHALGQPVFLAAGFLFDLIVCANYFFVGNFFVSNSTDLHNFFYFIPVASIFFVPVIAFKTESDACDEFLPLSDFALSLMRLAVCFAKYAVVVAPLLAVPFCVNFFGDVDTSQAFTGFAVIILYGAAVSAIAVFANALFANAVISFMASAALISFLYFLPSVIPASAGISFARHFSAASQGILDSRDLVFFIEAAAVLVLLASFLAEKKRGKRLSEQNKTTVFLLVAIFVLVAFDCSRFYFRLDMTRDNKFSVSEYSRSLIEKIDEPMLVTYYRTKKLQKKYAGVADIEEYLSAWCGVSKNVSLEIVDADEALSTVLSESGIMPQQTVADVSGKQTYETIYSGISMEYAGKISSVPFIVSAENLEYELAVRLETKQNRNVMVVAANGMNLESDYSYVVPYLSANGFLCSTADVTEENFYDKLLSFDGILLVLGSHLFSDSAAAAVEQFVIRGGNAFFAVSPYFVNVAGDWSVTKESSPLLDVLGAFGFEFGNCLVADESCASILFASEDGSSRQLVPYNFWISALPQERAKKGMTVFWGSPIFCGTDDGAKGVVFSSGKSVAVAEKESDKNIENLFETNPFGDMKIFFGDETERKPHVLVAEKTGGLHGFYDDVSEGNSHVIVAADQFLCANITMQYAGLAEGDLRNLDFIVNELLRLANANELADLRNKSASSSTFYKITDAESFVHACRKSVGIVAGVIVVFYATIFMLAGLCRKNWLQR